jgi:hypothetical protein
MTWAITIEHKLVSAANLRAGAGGFGRSARAQKHRSMAKLAVLGNEGVPALPVVVTLVRVGPRALDSDNLQFAFKAVRDGVADALGVKDHDPRVTWEYAQEKGAYAVRIELAARAT